jgi:antitoxin (DNA-binding transcriptional repressor) of toxin-antitoxin stability system
MLDTSAANWYNPRMDKDPPKTAAYSVTEAKERFPELVDRALNGENVVIMRDGRPLVELKPVPSTVEGRRITQADIDWLKANRVGRIMPKEDAGTFVSRMRDEDWERF